MPRSDPDARLVLASASPRRRELLAALGLPFTVRATETDERVEPGLTPPDAALRIAGRKLSAALSAGGEGEAPVLAADTIVVLDGELLGKPVDAAEARTMLTALSARAHDVYTAVVIAGAGGARQAVERTRVEMRRYGEEEITASIAAGTPFDKAGGYAIQDPVLHPVERCEGCYCNVMGLPLWTVFSMLGELLSGERPAPPDTAFARCRTCPLRPQQP